MKNKYLEDLKDLLDDYQMDESEKTDILNDYSEMHDSWSDKGLTDDEVKKKLGHPRSIIKDLTEGNKKVVRPIPGSEKAIALSPFVTLIIFFILGFGFDLWHPGWLVFILIPVVAIVMSMGKTKEDHLTTALSPFFATTTFLILGFGYDLWHPAWMIFLIIPVLGVWNSRYDMKKLDLLTALSPFITGLAYIILGMEGYWVEGWVVFMLIPMLGILNYYDKKVVFIWELAAIFGIVGYLYIGLTYENTWHYAALAFAPFVLISMLKNDWEDSGSMPKRYRIVVAVSSVIFLLSGFLFDMWAVSWLFLLAIPVYAIMTEVPVKERAISISPFVALVIFMIVGYYFDLWQYAWMIFIIIPMTAIVKNA
jgi:uncharacterized membrane protein